MNPFLARLNELMQELERQHTKQQDTLQQQNELIMRLTKENQTYKERLETLTKQSENQIHNFSIQRKQLQDTIEKLNSENSRLLKLLQSNKKP